MIESAGVNPVGDPVAGGGTKTANP
jgi:hypothetical protein